VGSGFEKMNPSPGNMRDGLLTDRDENPRARPKNGGILPLTGSSGILYAS